MIGVLVAMTSMKPFFLKLDNDQLNTFHQLKTTNDLKSHGPLTKGSGVPIHTHDETAVYATTQIAEFHDGTMKKVIGRDQDYNAVLVPKECRHGWLALENGTKIEHAFGVENIMKVFLAA